VVTLEPDLEQLLQTSLNGVGANAAALEPGLAERLQTRLSESVRRQEAAGEPAVLMVAPALRAALARFSERAYPACTFLRGMRFPTIAASAS